MIQRAGRTTRRESGFTIIELLIVAVIIGLLSSVAAPNLVGAERSSKNSRAMADAARIASQTLIYIKDNGTTPGATSYAKLYAGNAPNGTRYMPRVTDPWAASGTDYRYATTGVSGEVKAWSIGEDGVDSGMTGDDVGYSSLVGPTAY